MKKTFGLLIGGLLTGLFIWLFITHSSVNELKDDVERKQALVNEIEEKFEEVAVEVDAD